jgi:hypothetical protein
LIFQNAKNVGFEVEMSSVELVMYPLGCGLLVFHLNWMPEKLKDVPLTLDELRTYTPLPHILFHSISLSK